MSRSRASRAVSGEVVARISEPRFARLRLQFERPVQIRPHLGPDFRIQQARAHGVTHGSPQGFWISLLRSKRAFSQSRCSVRSDTFHM